MTSELEVLDVDLGSQSVRLVAAPSLRERLDTRYSRRVRFLLRDDTEVTDHERWRKDGKRKWVLENPAAAENPVWIGNFGYFFADLEQDRKLQTEIMGDERYSDPISHYSSKIEVLSEPLRFHSVNDVDVFERMQTAVVHFQSGMGFVDSHRDPVRADGYKFSDEVLTWLKMGIKGQNIADLFDALGGLTCVDPTVFSQFFSPGEILDFWKVLDGRAKKHQQQPFSTNNDVVTSGTDIMTPLQQLRRFSHDVGDNILIYRESAEDDRSLREDLTLIYQSTARLGLFLDLIELTGYQHVNSNRPVHFEDINVIFATTIAEGLKKGDLEYEEFADKMVSAIRRRRLDINDLPKLVKSFMGPRNNVPSGSSEADIESKKVPYEDLTIENMRLNRALLGDGLAVASVVLGDDARRSDILDQIQEKLMPEFVLKLRERGILQTDEAGYQEMGLTREVWKMHERRLFELEMMRNLHLVPDIGPGTLYLEYSTSAAPFHVGHEEILRDKLRLKYRDLKLAGILPSGFNGNVVLAIKVNKSKPASDNNVKAKDVSIEDRYPIVENSLRGIIGENVLIYPLDDPDVSTPERFASRTRQYPGVGIYRLMGDDKLRGEGGVQYPYRDRAMYNYAHIINLRHRSLNDFSELAQRMRQMFNNFPHGLMIELSQIVDTTSRGIREGLEKEIPTSDEVLATQVCPHNEVMDAVRAIWSK
jgi:hypothetical protein